MGLLPCLRRGSDRWWLPCSAEATEIIGRILIAKGRGDSIDAATRGIVVRCLRHDPPLLIFAALGCSGERVGLQDLVDWLVENLTGRFASGDAFVAAPTVGPAIQTRWNKLRDHFRVLPLERWLEDAALWLEVTGPKVSSAWREQWPQVDSSDDGVAEITPRDPGSMLQQLARSMQHAKSIEASFQQHLHKSKLGALKQLTYGLSHEINNPLANISTRAQQLQRGEKDPGRVATLQRIIDQVYRAHEMIADLMFFANPPDTNLEVVDLRSVVNSVAESFREEADRQAIRLEVTLPDQEVTSRVDARMIGEAVRALVRNAVDAIGCQGTIVLSLLTESGRLLIHVADSGPGLSDLARQHAFDPYFSGREAGRGLGLGLCRAYRIAKLHGGDVRLAGGPIGCVATISLPTEARI